MKEICKKCNDTGIIPPSKFRKWWLNFYYGLNKDYITGKKCKCKEQSQNITQYA
jgi:hypothetical protein